MASKRGYREAYLLGWSGRFGDAVITVNTLSREEAIKYMERHGYRVIDPNNIKVCAVVYSSEQPARCLKGVTNTFWKTRECVKKGGEG